MSVDQMGYQNVAIHAQESDRVEFIRKTYTTLFLAILSFIGIEAFLFQSGLAHTIAGAFFSVGQIGLLGVLAIFMVMTTLATSLAHKPSKGTQLMGLSLTVGAWSFMFAPLLVVASVQAPSAIPAAGLTTLLIFGALTAFVLITKKDFSFLRTALFMVSIAAVGAVISTSLLGWTMGVFFSIAMVVLASGYILYHTSAVLHQYGTDQHIGAAATLFGSVALLFWYVLRIFMSRD